MPAEVAAAIAAAPVYQSERTPLAYSLSELAQLSSISRRTIERAVLSGALRSRRIGGRRIVLRANALRWLSKDQPNGGA